MGKQPHPCVVVHADSRVSASARDVIDLRIRSRFDSKAEHPAIESPTYRHRAHMYDNADALFTPFAPWPWTFSS